MTKVKPSAADRNRTAEDAYWDILRIGMADPLGPETRRKIRQVVLANDPEWAYELLYASQLLAAKDPEDPHSPTTSIVGDEDADRLFEIIAVLGTPELWHRTVRTVFLRSWKKQHLLTRMVHVRERRWIEATIDSVYLLPDQKAILKYAITRC